MPPVLYVHPGFIDAHTHFDPTVFWDPLCDPTPQHGVTSALFGNCSLSLAPVRAHEQQLLQELFCYVEDLPSAVLDESLPWGWESYGDYLDVTESRGGFGLNMAGMVGHTMLRQYVMGAQAWERIATEGERAQIAALLRESLRAGAFGMSTSLGFDEDRNKRPVPSRLADDAEFAALVDVIADEGRYLTFIPDPNGKQMRKDVQRMADLCAPRDVLHAWIGIFHNQDRPDWARGMLDFAAELRGCRSAYLSRRSARGRSTSTSTGTAGCPGSRWSTVGTGWCRRRRRKSRRMLRSPEWRAVAREEWDRVPRTMIPHKHPERIRLVTATRPENAKWIGSTLADLVGRPRWASVGRARRLAAGKRPFPGIVGVGVSNADPDGVAETLVHPASVIANSDAGAHLTMMCAIGDTTLTLTRHVRDRGDMSVEQAVHRMTGQIADVFGFAGRGVLAEGNHGDVTIFALDELDWKDDVFVDDLPLGASRLRRPPGGFRQTIVAGTVVQEAGELTGARPGRLLRAGRRS